MASYDEEGSERLILELIYDIAHAAGISGMVGGQAVDIESEGREVKYPTVHYIHTHKTGALISVSIRVGARLGGADKETLKAFSQYGENIGLAFQIIDDILNVEGKVHLIGKNIGSDAAKGKATYPAILGVEESKKRARQLIESAVGYLSPFGNAVDPLREIAWFMFSREY